MFKDLKLKERTAIELKYLGNTHQEISEKIDIPKATVDDWFTERGKLRQDYDFYIKDMNRKRQAEALKKYIESDENILTITTNIMRQIGTDLGDGKLELSVTDFKKAWEIQRTTLGKPTDIKSQNVSFNQEELDKEAEAVKDIIESEKEKDE